MMFFYFFGNLRLLESSPARSGDPSPPLYIGVFRFPTLIYNKKHNNKNTEKFTINLDLLIDIYDKSFIIIIVINK